MSKALVVMMLSVRAIRERPLAVALTLDCMEERLKKAERWASGREEMAAAWRKM